MSETIQGSKSSNYIKDQVPGVSDSSDSLTHQSVQNLWNGRGAADVLIHGLYKPSILAMAIEAGSVRRKIKITSHGANEGDFLKIVSGASAGEEIAIIKVIDADYIIIAKEINVSIGDSVEILRAVTPSYNADGSLNVSVVPSPSSYNRKSAGSTVVTTVLEDLDTPSASRPMPVAIHSIDGAGITVNAGDLSVSINHVNDSVAIGDGTTLAAVTGSNELKVSDASTHTSLTTLNAKDFATSAKQDTQTTALGTLDTSVNSLLKPASTLNKVSTVDTITNTVTVTGTVTANAGTNLNTSTLAIESGGNLDSINSKIPSNLTVSSTRLLTDGSGVTQPVSGSVTANLGTIAGVATETTLSALNTKVPANLTVTSTRLLVDGSGVTQPVSGSVTANIGTTNGLALDATLTGGSQVAIAKSGAKGATTAAVITSTAQSVDRQALDVQIRTSAGVVVDTFAGIGPLRSKVNQLFNDYSSTPVTTSAYVQLIASTSATSTKLEIFDSSGEVLILAVGAAASEVDQLYIFPGGNGPVELNIPSGSRISVKAKTTTASAGLLVINLYS